MSRQYFVAGSSGTLFANDSRVAEFSLAGIYLDASSPALTSVSITGVEGTGSVGAITDQASSSVALSGVAGTCSVGTAGAEVDSALSGIEATSSIGDIGYQIDSNLSLVGVEAAGNAADIVSELDVGALGVSAASDVGLLTTSFSSSVSLVGVSASGLVWDSSIAVVTNVGAGRQYSIWTGSSFVYVNDDSTKDIFVLGSYLNESSLLETQISIAPGIYGTGQVGSFDYAIDNALLGVEAYAETSSITFVQFGVEVAGLAGEVFSNAGGDLQNGVEATSSVGDISALTEVDVSLPSVLATGSVGIIVASPQIGGTEGTGAVGLIVAGYFLDGVESTAAVESVSAESGNDAAGIEAAGQCGDIYAAIALSLSDSSGIGFPGDLVTDTSSLPDGVEGSCLPGDIVVSGTELQVVPDGVSATGFVQDIIGSSPSIDGVEGTTGISDIVLDVISAVGGVEATSSIGAIYTAAITAIGVTSIGIAGVITPHIDEFVLPVSIAGVAASSAVGSIAGSVDRTASGVAATGSVATLIGSFASGLAGVEGTSAVQSIIADVIAKLGSVSGTGVVGQVGFAQTINPMAGIEGTGVAGAVVSVFSSNASANGVEGVGVAGDLGLGEDNQPSILGVFSSIVPGVVAGILLIDSLGVTATGDVETVSTPIDNATLGVFATGSVSQAVRGTTLYVDGIEATGSVGAFAYSLKLPFAGVFANGNAGNISVINLGISGVAGNSFVGSVGVYINPFLYADPMYGIVESIAGLPILKIPASIELDDFALYAIKVGEIVPDWLWKAA